MLHTECTYFWETEYCSPHRRPQRVGDPSPGVHHRLGSEPGLENLPALSQPLRHEPDQHHTTPPHTIAADPIPPRPAKFRLRSCMYKRDFQLSRFIWGRLINICMKLGFAREKKDHQAKGYLSSPNPPRSSRPVWCNSGDSSRYDSRSSSKDVTRSCTCGRAHHRTAARHGTIERSRGGGGGGGQFSLDSAGKAEEDAHKSRRSSHRDVKNTFTPKHNNRSEHLNHSLALGQPVCALLL